MGQLDLLGGGAAAANDGIDAVREEARGCTACELHRLGTQTVFGEGPAPARFMLVGEQPGDREDREGRPFVGPAGQLLDRMLEEAGIDRSAVYVTNAVKHFRWRPGGGGPRRIHEKPGWKHINACRPWLDRELVLVRPDVLVCLGATAAQALFGKTFRITQRRGERVESPLARIALATLHPSAVLRADDDERQAMHDLVVADLRAAAEHARG